MKEAKKREWRERKKRGGRRKKGEECSWLALHTYINFFKKCKLFKSRKQINGHLETGRVGRRKDKLEEATRGWRVCSPSERCWGCVGWAFMSTTVYVSRVTFKQKLTALPPSPGAVSKHTRQPDGLNNLQEKVLTLAHTLRVQSIRWGHPGKLVTCHSQEAESKEGWCLAHIRSFIQSRTPIPGMISFRLGWAFLSQWS